MFQEARMRSASLLAAILLVLLAAPAFAKGPTVRIRIEGGSLRAPIVLTDPQVLDPFRVWEGPGASSYDNCESQVSSFIVNWSHGATAGPAHGLPCYKVSFWADEPQENLVYAVYYEFDPARKQGYVYLPGPGDDAYQLNTGSTLRDVEGKWFRSWGNWDRVAFPLIAAAIKN
jgi:hypothetical protein